MDLNVKVLEKCNSLIFTRMELEKVEDTSEKGVVYLSVKIPGILWEYVLRQACLSIQPFRAISRMNLEEIKKFSDVFRGFSNFGCFCEILGVVGLIGPGIPKFGLVWVGVMNPSYNLLHLLISWLWVHVSVTLLKLPSP